MEGKISLEQREINKPLCHRTHEQTSNIKKQTQSNIKQGFYEGNKTHLHENH